MSGVDRVLETYFRAVVVSGLCLIWIQLSMVNGRDHPDFIITHKSRITTFSETFLRNKHVYDWIACTAVLLSVIDSAVIYFSMKNFYGLSSAVMSIDRISGRRAIFANLMHSFIGIMWFLFFFIYYRPFLTIFLSVFSVLFASWRIWLARRVKMASWLNLFSIPILVSTLSNVVLTMEGIHSWFF